MDSPLSAQSMMVNVRSQQLATKHKQNDSQSMVRGNVASIFLISEGKAAANLATTGALKLGMLSWSPTANSLNSVLGVHRRLKRQGFSRGFVPQ